MKRIIFILAIFAVLFAGAGLVVAQQQSQGVGQSTAQPYGPPQGQGWFCPWDNSEYGRGPGSMQQPGAGQGGYDLGRGKMRSWNNQDCPRGSGLRQGRCNRSFGRGAGMMQGSGGRGTGSGIKDRGWSRDRSGSYGGQQPTKPLQKDTARDLAQNYAAGNPNLKVGQVTEQNHVFAATIVTRDGSLVEKLEIDKNTGWMRKGY